MASSISEVSRVEACLPQELNTAVCVQVSVSGLRKGRVYDFRIDGPKSRDGESILHPEAYYTLNELAR